VEVDGPRPPSGALAEDPTHRTVAHGVEHFFEQDGRFGVEPVRVVQRERHGLLGGRRAQHIRDCGGEMQPMHANISGQCRGALEDVLQVLVVRRCGAGRTRGFQQHGHETIHDGQRDRLLGLDRPTAHDRPIEQPQLIETRIEHRRLPDAGRPGQHNAKGAPFRAHALRDGSDALQ
jgi:hypothetical protein